MAIQIHFNKYHKEIKVIIKKKKKNHKQIEAFMRTANREVLWLE